MNNARFEDNNLRPTYMSQQEANELMELWAERQREESSRQSLITVHDVAEATQLSVLDVEKLLHEIRTKQTTSDRLAPVPTARRESQPSHEPTLVEAYIRLAPITGVISFCYWLTLWHSRSYYYYSFVQKLVDPGHTFWLIYSIVIAIAFAPKYLKTQRSLKRTRKYEGLTR